MMLVDGLSAGIERHGEHLFGQGQEGFANSIGAVSRQTGDVGPADENVSPKLFSWLPSTPTHRPEWPKHSRCRDFV